MSHEKYVKSIDILIKLQNVDKIDINPKKFTTFKFLLGFFFLNRRLTLIWINMNWEETEEMRRKLLENLSSLLNVEIGDIKLDEISFIRYNTISISIKCFFYIFFLFDLRTIESMYLSKKKLKYKLRCHVL